MENHQRALSLRQLLQVLRESHSEKHDETRKLLSNVSLQSTQNSSKVIPELIRLALGDSDYVIRLCCAKLLRDLMESHPEILRVLQGTLFVDSIPLREMTLEVLAIFGECAQDTIPDLLRILHDDEDPMNHQAAHTLGQIGIPSSEVLEGLLHALRDKQSQRGTQAAQAFLRLSPHSMPFLQQALLQEQGLVHLRLASLLAQLGQTNTVPILIRNLLHPDPWFRVHAATALCRQGGEYHSALKTLLTCISIQQRPLQLFAIEALGEYGHHSQMDLVAPLLRVLDQDPMCKAAVIEALGKLGASQPNAVRALFPFLQDRDEWIVADTLDTLKQQLHLPSHTSYLPRIIQLTSSSHVWIRLSALELAVQFEDPSIEPMLQDAQNDPNERIRSLALEHRIPFAPSERVLQDWLQQGLRDESEFVRCNTIQHIARLGQTSLLSELYQAAQDPQPQIQIAATQALCQLDLLPNNTLELTQILLKETKTSPRIEVAKTLAHLGKYAETSIPALLQTLRDSDFQVQAWSAYALGCIGYQSPKILHALKELKQHPHTLVRWHIGQALGKLLPEPEVFWSHIQASSQWPTELFLSFAIYGQFIPETLLFSYLIDCAQRAIQREASQKRPLPPRFDELLDLQHCSAHAEEHQHRFQTLLQEAQDFTQTAEKRFDTCFEQRPALEATWTTAKLVLHICTPTSTPLPKHIDAIHQISLLSANAAAQTRHFGNEIQRTQLAEVTRKQEVSWQYNHLRRLFQRHRQQTNLLEKWQRNYERAVFR